MSQRQVHKAVPPPLPTCSLSITMCILHEKLVVQQYQGREPITSPQPAWASGTDRSSDRLGDLGGVLKLRARVQKVPQPCSTSLRQRSSGLMQFWATVTGCRVEGMTQCVRITPRLHEGEPVVKGAGDTHTPESLSGAWLQSRKAQRCRKDGDVFQVA